MSVLIDHQAVNVATGSQDLGPVNLPDGLSTLTIRIARCTTPTPTIWPDVATSISVGLFVSVDNGANWIASGSLTSTGGIVVRLGVESPETVMDVSPLPVGNGRQVKATVAVQNGPLVSNVTVEAT